MPKIYNSQDPNTFKAKVSLFYRTRNIILRL
jgi:hypothetical protein